jgi:hypothetical protein
MPHPKFDRHQLKFKPLSDRKDKVFIEKDHVPPDASPQAFSAAGQAIVDETVARMVKARAAGKPRMLTFGAHTIKNGLAPVLIKLMEDGWVTHLATNGAGIIHDWEFAFQGHSSEDVQAGVEKGEFGLWRETGYYVSLAINLGAYQGLGYGEAVGSMVENEGLDIPSSEMLHAEISVALGEGHPEKAAAAADLLHIIQAFELEPGRMEVEHPFKHFGLQAAAYRLDLPFTSHPMIGHDIIYEHPMNHVASIGRCAQRDFLSFARAVSDIDGGVYMSIGSAVMSPMIFEKSLAMAQNLALQEGKHIDNHFMLVVDLQESHWDWTQGEPPVDHADYYLRFNKSFNRMGGTMCYLSADNRDFLLALSQGLKKAAR